MTFVYFLLEGGDAIYENNFELAKFLLEDGEVDANTKDDCGNTPLIAVCQQTTVQNEEEAVKFTTKHLIVSTTMTSKVYAYLNKRLPPIILR
jgi:ankyrin repeat protein